MLPLTLSQDAAMANATSLIPVNVLTGYLGSGKTTLLRDLLSSPALRDTAVLVNEFGEVGLDHHLLEPVAESMLLLENGCLCCAIRGDLQTALRELYSKRERGEVPFFSRVVVETSGLADPVPIAYTVQAEPVLQHHFRLGSVVTTVDAAIGVRQLDEHPESVKQVAVADRLVLTKTDLADAADTQLLRERLRRLNSAALMVETPAAQTDPLKLLGVDSADERDWMRISEDGLIEPPLHHGSHSHEAGISSFCLNIEGAIDWTAFGIWMTMLLNRHGDKVLRIKGMLNVAGLSGPVFINGVQHIVHPPTHLPAWPDQERVSRIVFIIRDIDREPLENSLRIFNSLAARDANKNSPSPWGEGLG